MAINYAVQAEVIDIRADRPKPTDIFLVDTNVWLWMKPIEVTIGSATTDAVLTRLSSQHLDGHDLFLLEAMTGANVTQRLTDDGDFCTVPGIQVFTANRQAIFGRNRPKLRARSVRKRQPSSRQELEANQPQSLLL